MMLNNKIRLACLSWVSASAMAVMLTSGCLETDTEVRQIVVEQFGTAEVARVSAVRMFVIRDTNGAIWFVDASIDPTNSKYPATKLFEAPK